MNWENFGQGAVAGGLLPGLAYGIFGGDSPNPADSANKYFKQIPGQIKPYYQPYINMGRQTMPGLQQQYTQLMNNPQGLYNQLSQGYTKSPGYDFRMQQGQQAIGNAQAAGGMSGTSQHQMLGGQLAQKMAGDDFQNYLSSVLGMYGSGLSGMTGLNQMGYNASNELANSLAGILGTQGQFAYAGQAGENQRHQGAMNNIFGGLGSLASSIGGLFGG
jgi:hypothetical protein